MIDGRDDQALLMEKLSCCERLHDLWKTQDFFSGLRSSFAGLHAHNIEAETTCRLAILSRSPEDSNDARPAKCPLLTSEQGERI